MTISELIERLEAIKAEKQSLQEEACEGNALVLWLSEPILRDQDGL